MLWIIKHIWKVRKRFWLFEKSFFGENLVDTIQPFLEIAAAALEDKSLLISHPTELLSGNLLNAHSFISSILVPCS